MKNTELNILDEILEKCNIGYVVRKRLLEKIGDNENIVRKRKSQ